MKSVATIGATQFKARCLAILDNLAPEGLVVTKHGRPVARVIPCPQPPAALIGALRGRLTVRGDVHSTGLAWEVVHGVPLLTRDARIRRSKVVPLA